MSITKCITESRIQLGSNIKHQRKEQRLTQEQLGLMIGRDRSYISRIERGRCNATFDTIVLIAGGLGIPASMLLEGVDELEENTKPIPVHFSMPIYIA